MATDTSSALPMNAAHGLGVHWDGRRSASKNHLIAAEHRPSRNVLVSRGSNAPGRCMLPRSLTRPFPVWALATQYQSQAPRCPVAKIKDVDPIPEEDL